MKRKKLKRKGFDIDTEYTMEALNAKIIALRRK